MKVDDFRKVKRRILIPTGHGAKANSKERTKEDEQTSSNRDASQEVNALLEEMLDWLLGKSLNYSSAQKKRLDSLLNKSLNYSSKKKDTPKVYIQKRRLPNKRFNCSHIKKKDFQIRA